MTLSNGKLSKPAIRNNYVSAVTAICTRKSLALVLWLTSFEEDTLAAATGVRRGNIPSSFAFAVLRFVTKVLSDESQQSLTGD